MAILDDTREGWNARPPLRPRTSVAWADRIGVSWHWIGPGKGPSATGPHSACLAQVLDWQWQHQHKQPPDGPWKDIGYNALICQHGRAIEGRGLTYSGSHSPGVNVSHIGVQFMVGSGTPGGANPAMLARAVRLRADIGRLGKNIRRDWGHRDDPQTSTACPGDALYKWVHSGGPTKTLTTQEDEVTPQDIKAIIDGVLGAKVVDASKIPFGGALDPDLKITLPEAASYAMRWSLEGRDAGTLAARLAEALAAKGGALTADEVKAAFKAALSESVELDLSVKPAAVTE